jgi:hypothetical protein
MVEATGSKKKKTATKKSTKSKKTKAAPKDGASAAAAAGNNDAEVGDAAAKATEMMAAMSLTSDKFTWETSELKQLVKEVEKARDAGKYLVIWDKNGSVDMFFKYKGHLFDWAPKQLKLTMAGEEKAVLLDACRKSIVETMRTGDKLLVDFDKLNPDLNEDWMDDAIFNANKVFDRAEWL